MRKTKEMWSVTDKDHVEAMSGVQARQVRAHADLQRGRTHGQDAQACTMAASHTVS